MQISGWLQCWWWWCVRLLDWLEPVIPPHQLCVCCAVVYRPGATTGYDIVAAQPSAQRQAANRASYTPYSPTATLSSSHYYYHILTLRNCSVCTVEYQGASDVIQEMLSALTLWGLTIRHLWIFHGSCYAPVSPSRWRAAAAAAVKMCHDIIPCRYVNM